MRRLGLLFNDIYEFLSSEIGVPATPFTPTSLTDDPNTFVVFDVFFNIISSSEVGSTLGSIRRVIASFFLLICSCRACRRDAEMHAFLEDGVFHHVVRIFIQERLDPEAHENHFGVAAPAA